MGLFGRTMGRMTQPMVECASRFFFHRLHSYGQSYHSNYPDYETSRKLNTTYATRDSFILRADDTRVLDPAGPGRDSARIRSKKSFTKHVAM